MGHGFTRIANTDKKYNLQIIYNTLIINHDVVVVYTDLGSVKKVMKTTI